MRMVYKPVREQGYTEIASPRNSLLKYITGGALRLDSTGQEYHAQTGDQEVGINILSGIAAAEIVDGNGRRHHLERVGGRMNPFEGCADTLYVPVQSQYKLTVIKGPFAADVFSVPAEQACPPFVARAEGVRVDKLGRLNWARQVRQACCIDVPTARILTGETLVCSGNWCNFPPHKHDVVNPPVELPAEELYVYHFDSEDGFGMIRLYSKGEHDEAYAVREGCAIIVDKGYHPFTVSPGYRCCFSFCLAGPEKSYGTSSNDPAHEWIKRSEILL